MTDIIQETATWHNRTMGTMAVEALQKNGFEAVYFDRRQEAVEHMLGFVKSGMTIGFGGSMTLVELGLTEHIKAKGAQPALELTPADYEDFNELGRKLKKTVQTEIYFTSSNAVTLDGALVNIDGGGNRVTAMMYGPEKVIVAAGINKICRDEAAAWERIRMVAAPRNARRLNMPTPCSQTGICMNCKHPARICRLYTVMRCKPFFTDVIVVIIGETLGF
jgi:L-lactate utilization protein LutB